MDVTPEDFKQVFCKVHQDFRRAVIDLYTCFDEMQVLYDKFSKHSETVEDHHHWMRKASTSIEQVTGWKKHINKRPDGLPSK